MKHLRKSLFLIVAAFVLLATGCASTKASGSTESQASVSQIKSRGVLLVGITITAKRLETMDMSEGYLANGKTILCRKEEAQKFCSLSDVDKSDVLVMVNPGGLNEKFAYENLKNAKIIVHDRNEEIPSLVAEGKADIMITEITEAPWYVQNDTRLSAPLLSEPFTHGEIGVLMRRGQTDLLAEVNKVIQAMKKDGSLRALHKKYDAVFFLCSETGGFVV